MTFGIVNNFVSATTTTREAHPDLRLCPLATTSARGDRQDLRLRLCRCDGSRGSPGPSALPPTSLLQLLRLEGLDGTFGFVSDVTLTISLA